MLGRRQAHPRRRQAGAGASAAPQERGATPERIEWSSRRSRDWERAKQARDRASARALYEELGGVLADELASQGGHPVLSTPAVNDRIRRRLAEIPGRRALDVGCGPTPVASNSLAAAGFVAVGIDVARSILRIAQRTAAPGVRLAAADGEALPFPDASFDLVTCDDTIEHVFDQAALVAEMARVLAPGGRLLLVTPNASALHVLRARVADLAAGRRLPREAYHITASHVRELRWRELSVLVRPWFELRAIERVPYGLGGRWRLADLAVRLPGLWRLAPVHFLDLERRPDPGAASIAAHYRRRGDGASQTSPGAVQAALAEALPLLGGDGLLVDVGAGTGANLAAARAHGRRAIGVEISLAAARQAAQRAPVVVADAARLPLRAGAASCAVCTEVLEHLEDPAAALAEIARVLAPGGRAYVTTPNYANLAGAHKWWADRRSGARDWNPWGAHAGGYERFMTGRRLAAAAAPRFKVLRARGLDHGQAITGRFAVLDALAWSRPGRAALSRALPRLARSRSRLAVWHGMHIELLLERS